ncbi:MAG: putative Ig domain-containing protein, partial [Synergistaceae bacterium]|nr:putative Ig domain-containing protein [Synergistaceae bacterium]
KMRDDVNSGKIKLLRYYKLTADLDISGYTDWEPIGQDSSYPFRGHFDGNEHTVTVKMTRTDMGYTGLFGYVEGGGIKNLSIAGDVKTSSQTTSGKYFSGGIAACISGGTIDNCKFEGKLIMSTTNDKDDLYAGGIAGRVSDGTTITNSRVDGTINVSTLDEGKSSLYAGGITGYIYGNATVSSCRFDGEISVLGANIADSLYAGGIAGYAYSEGRKYSEGSPVTLNKNSVGKKNSSTVVKALYSFSNNPNTYAGGIVGILYAYSWDSYSNYDYGRGEKAFFSVTGNYSRLKTQAGHTDMLTYGNIYRSYYVHDNSYPFSFSDNKEYDPDEYSDPEPDPETAAPVITTSSLPSGTVDVPYSFEFEANGEKPITWTAEGTLPEGLVFKDGKLTGTPTAAGSFKLTVTATHDFDSAAKDFTLTIASVSLVAKPVITTESLPDAKVGESYSAELSATSDEQVKWSAEGLPAGLELDESTGAITGIPTEAGTFTVKVTAENTGGAESKELTLVVEEPSAPPAPMVIETSKWERENGKLIVETTAGERYEFEALEGTDGYGFVINGELPGGLVINLPEMWGLDTDKSFAVTVADGDKIVEASEVPGLDANACRILGANIVTLAMPDTVMTAFQFIAPSITTAEDLGTFTADMDISIQLKAEGTTWKMKWSAENLPDVLNIGEDGLLSGSIAAAGEYSFTAKVENVAGEDSRTFKLTVKAAPTRPVSPVITTAKNLGTFKVGEEVSIQLEATGTTPITWLKTDGTLPDGLVVDSSGLLSGTLTKAGKYTFLVSATNEVGSVSRGFTMTVESNIQVPSITSAQDLGTYEYEADVDKHIEATGTTPITWSMSGNPSWLEIDSETGDITGTTPKKSGEFTFTVTASNSGGKDSRKFTLKVKTTVAEVTAPTIKTDSLPNGTNGEIYNATLDADGSSPITWAATGLPDGLSLNASGKLTGVPKVGGNFTVVVTAENSAGNDTKEYTLTIAESNKVNPPKITTDELSDATVGDEYNVQFTAEGKDITWTATWKALTGLTLTPDGVLRGTPTASGTFNIVVKAKNKAGTDYANLTLKVNDKPNETVSLPEVKSSKIPDAYQDEEYSYFLEATGTGLKWSLAEPDSLPKGLELTEDGEITGRVDTSKATTFKFKVIASNSAGSSPAKQISLKVVAKTPTFKSDALKEAKWNKKYSFTLKVQNMKPTVWGIEGDLPEGVKFDKGKFSGKPTEAGEFDLTISASNGAVELSEEFTLVVKGVTPKIKGSFKKGTEGEPYKSVLKATGVTPLTWYFEDLPDGLDYTTNETGEECTITGTPEGAFNSKIQVTVENGSGDDQTAGKGIKMTIKAVKPKITTAVEDIPDGTVGKRYSYQLKFSPATAEVLWSYTGDMPEGLRLDEDSGVIEGVPEEAGTNFKITVKVENVNKASYKSTRVFYITINPAEPATDKPEEPEEPEAPEFENGVAYHERGELTAETLAVIAGNDEVIAAVLPALEVEEAGLYEFTVSLDVNAPVDGLLVWHSFPNGEDDENDAENAVFLNEDGETIERVPETYSVTVSAWLEPGIIYEPIIAVRIKD